MTWCACPVHWTNVYLSTLRLTTSQWGDPETLSLSTKSYRQQANPLQKQQWIVSDDKGNENLFAVGARDGETTHFLFALSPSRAGTVTTAEHGWELTIGQHCSIILSLHHLLLWPALLDEHWYHLLLADEGTGADRGYLSIQSHQSLWPRIPFHCICWVGVLEYGNTIN